MKYFRAFIRYVSFVVLTLGIYSAWYVGAFFVRNKNSWRQLIFRQWSKGFASIAGMKIEVVGMPPVAPFFLVSNHLGYMDIPALRAVCDGVFVAKGEIENWFMAGKIVGNMGNIYIDRQNRRDIPRAGAEVIEKLNSGEGVFVFPEGTSTKGAEVLPFNSSFLEFAAQINLPVSYASISYQTPANEPAASASVCWWDDSSFGEHLWQLFQLKRFTAIIKFGGEEIINHNRKELAVQLREKVLENFTPMV